MYFEIISEIEEIETITAAGRIRDVMLLRKQYGFGDWRKLKGVAKIRLQNGGRTEKYECILSACDNPVCTCDTMSI